MGQNSDESHFGTLFSLSHHPVPPVARRDRKFLRRRTPHPDLHDGGDASVSVHARRGVYAKGTYFARDSEVVLCDRQNLCCRWKWRNYFRDGTDEDEHKIVCEKQRDVKKMNEDDSPRLLDRRDLVREDLGCRDMVRSLSPFRIVIARLPFRCRMLRKK